MSETSFTETVPNLTDPLSDGLAVETVVSLSDYAEEVGGPLPRGWYAAEIIAGYATRSGKQFETNDSVSQKGDSRNLTLCLRITPKTSEARNLQSRLNYRTADFTPERLSYIKEQRGENAGVKGAWQDRDAQRSSLAIATFGQLEKAIGFAFASVNGVAVPKLLGQKLEVRLTIDENGYNAPNAFAKLGQFTAPQGKKAKAA